MKFIVAGCARNCEKYIKSVFKNIKKICNIIDVRQIIVAYDESNDKTLLEIIKQKKCIDVDIKILINKDPLTSYRTQNICNARNKLLEEINAFKPTIDKFIMMDFDDVCSKPINLNIFKEGLMLNKDCVTFNNKTYYDFWALSIDNYQYSAWHFDKPHKYLKLLRLYLLKKFSETKKKYVECDSAFNGLAIYKLKSFKNCKYQSLMDNEYYCQEKINYINKTFNLYINNTNMKYDCEHRIFHLMAKKKNKAKIVILKQHLFPEYIGSHTNFIYM